MKRILTFVSAILLAQGLFAQQFSLPIMPEKMWPSDYAKYEKDVLNCCDWLLNVSPDFNKPKHTECSSFLVRWLSGSPQVKVVIHPDLVDIEKGDLLIAFMSGWTRHSLKNKEDGALLCANVAVEETLRFYVEHKKEIGKSKKMEKLLKKQADGSLAAYVYSVLSD